MGFSLNYINIVFTTSPWYLDRVQHALMDFLNFDIKMEVKMLNVN